MGIFTVDVQVCRPGRRPKWGVFEKVIVDPGSEATWLPGADLQALGIDVFKAGQTFIMANGQRVRRDVRIAVIQSGAFKTVDEVVLAKPGDLLLLTARTLGGFNARIDPRKKRLVAAGPIPAAPSWGRSPGGAQRDGGPR